MSKSAIGLMLVIAALAGCAGGDDSTTTPAPSTTTTPKTTTDGSPTTTAPTTSPGTTTTPAPPANDPPQGSLSASIQSGQVPVLVEFTMNGQDPEGKPVSWALDVDGDGSLDHTGATLPRTVQHEYTEAGSYNATLYLTDGQKGSNYTLVINATLEGSTYPRQVVIGSYIPSVESCAYTDHVLTNFSDVSFVVDPLTIGREFEAVFDPFTDPVFLRVDFYDGAGLHVGVTPLYPHATPGETVFVGAVPPNAVMGSLSSCGGAPIADVVYTVF